MVVDWTMVQSLRLLATSDCRLRAGAKFARAWRVAGKVGGVTHTGPHRVVQRGAVCVWQQPATTLNHTAYRHTADRHWLRSRPVGAVGPPRIAAPSPPSGVLVASGTPFPASGFRFSFSVYGLGVGGEGFVEESCHCNEHATALVPKKTTPSAWCLQRAVRKQARARKEGATSPSWMLRSSSCASSSCICSSLCAQASPHHRTEHENIDCAHGSTCYT